jgi:DNA-binding GntR family transcriptional regulator
MTDPTPTTASQNGPGRRPTRTTELPEYRTKSDLVYERVRELILTAELRPGEVVDQTTLCESLGVSRMPLRQAFVRLAAAKLIYLTPHHSAVVMPLLASDIEEIYATRESLESLLIRAAIPHLTDEDHAELGELLRRADDPAVRGVPRQFAVLDRQFHTRLYLVSGYERAQSYFENLRDLSDRYVAFYYAEADRRYSEDAAISANCHGEILARCKAGDADRAIAAMRTDLWRTAEHLLHIARTSLDDDTSPNPA